MLFKYMEPFRSLENGIRTIPNIHLVFLPTSICTVRDHYRTRDPPGMIEIADGVPPSYGTPSK